MNVLGIETATSICSVGLHGERGFVGEISLSRGLRHAELTAAAVDHLIQSSGWTMQDLDCVAVSIGPGSFTGLRIGLGLAKGIALGLGKPVVPVPTMDGMVWNLPGSTKRACVVLRARKGEIFRGIFSHREGCWLQEGEIQTLSVRSWRKNMKRKETILLGEAEVGMEIPEWIETVSGILGQPSGYAIAALGHTRMASGLTADPDSLVPVYGKQFAEGL